MENPTNKPTSEPTTGTHNENNLTPKPAAALAVVVALIAGAYAVHLRK